jgi:hypothetical protein
MHTHPLNSKAVKLLFMREFFVDSRARRTNLKIPWDEIPRVTSRAGQRLSFDSSTHSEAAAQLTKRAAA